jgi:hypothetical protein
MAMNAESAADTAAAESAAPPSSQAPSDSTGPDSACVKLGDLRSVEGSVSGA